MAEASLPDPTLWSSLVAPESQLRPTVGLTEASSICLCRPVCPPGMAMGKGPISLSQALALRTSYHLLLPSLHPTICSPPCSLCPEAPGSVLSLHCDKYSHCPEVKTEPLEGKGTVPGLGNTMPPHSMPARTGRGSGCHGHTAAGAAP